jgi:hypothetical protein
MCKNKIRKNKQFQPREIYDIMEITRVGSREKYVP